MAVRTRRVQRMNRDSIDAPDQQLGILMQCASVFVYIPPYCIDSCVHVGFLNINVLIFKDKKTIM